MRGREFDPRIRAGLDQQLLGRVQGDDFRVVHDGHAVAEHLGLFHVMRGQDDRFALGLDRPHQLPEVAAGLGIEAGGRLVEEEDLRVVDQRDGDGKPLLLPAGEFPGLAAGLFRQLDFRQLLPGIDFAVIAGGKDVDQFGKRQVLEERRTLKLDADDRFDGVRLLANVAAFNMNVAGGRPFQPFDHFQRGGFAGAVGADDAEGLAAVDRKGDVVDGREAAVPFRQVRDFNAGGHGGKLGKSMRGGCVRVLEYHS